MAVANRLPTEPLREEHRMLIPRLEALDRLAADYFKLSPQEARERTAAAVDFLCGELLAHASAEEAVLYPSIERVTKCSGMTATMSADHHEITRRVQGLRVAIRSPNVRLEAIPLALAGLAAIVLLHFHKEEEVLLPILDRELSVDQADELFARMAEQARETSCDELSPLP